MKKRVEVSLAFVLGVIIGVGLCRTKPTVAKNPLPPINFCDMISVRQDSPPNAEVIELEPYAALLDGKVLCKEERKAGDQWVVSLDGGRLRVYCTLTKRK